MFRYFWVHYIVTHNPYGVRITIYWGLTCARKVKENVAAFLTGHLQKESISEKTSSGAPLLSRQNPLLRRRTQSWPFLVLSSGRWSLGGAQELARIV